jgi:hypothetical protein
LSHKKVLRHIEHCKILEAQGEKRQETWGLLEISAPGAKVSTVTAGRPAIDQIVSSRHLSW